VGRLLRTIRGFALQVRDEAHGVVQQRIALHLHLGA
jgi:hypothetical protein